jgi:hypothetical protein
METLNLSHFKEQLEHKNNKGILYVMTMTLLEYNETSVNLVQMPIDKPEEMENYEYLRHEGIFPVVNKIN